MEKPAMSLHPVVAAVTERIIARSRPTRTVYLARIAAAARAGRVHRADLSCTNLAHGFAGMPASAKLRLRAEEAPNLAIVSAYNDMLSAHQPLSAFPAWIKDEAERAGATAQFAGGVPAMCDGITQGQPGMELSLFSRDVIALSTAVALSHNMFDAALYLGVCDKIVPGLLIGALAFGHLPAVFVPAGPMPSGLPNAEKARIREAYTAGRVDRATLLESEAASYHAPGTCTFYGTANSNQMLMEAMGLHLPGSAFVLPGTPLREALVRAAARTALGLTRPEAFLPVGQLVDEKTLVNAIVTLLATGGSTNHTLHLVAIARVAGIRIDWTDFDELSRVVPLLARVYPNGEADVNAFHTAGGAGFVLRELLAAGRLHDAVQTVSGPGLGRHLGTPALAPDGRLTWEPLPAESRDETVLRPAHRPFSPEGGLRLLTGNLGRAVIKTSAVDPAHWQVSAPARVFASQEALIAAYRAGALNTDFVAVLPFQGPRANGMPELHKLTPTLSLLQRQGHRVALVTDGRMSGASGKVPAALHLTPEAAEGGPLARIRDGDPIRIDAHAGRLEVEVTADAWAQRTPASANLAASAQGLGRELFAGLRSLAGPAEEGASTFLLPDWVSSSAPGQ
ncbi:6-phosphogluconate dehydratase [Gulbenkiania indica]|uniref:Phosphogluconate dehydratase n=2 Tax=Gulbenkiania indica TaxID=375574 RepID=A0A0K6GY60_9NEIS|nr:6-phosphogluconate dehydratase [Gulbenkiania indica]